MKNKTLAIIGIGTYILSVSSSAVDLEGNSIAPIALIAISGIATVVFIVMATIRLWKEAKNVSIILVSSAAILFILMVIQTLALPSYGSLIIILSNIARVMYFIAFAWTIIKLFKLNIFNKNEKTAKYQDIERELTGNSEFINLQKSMRLTALGIRFGQQGKFDQSINALKEVMSLSPDIMAAYIPLAMAYRGNGMLDEALEILHQLIEKMKSAQEKSDISDFDIYFTFATIYIRKGDKIKTIEYAKKAIGADNNQEARKKTNEAIQFGVINNGEIDHYSMIEALKEIIKEYEE
jgi:tetratricopeptide (TPR) repeat protein